MNNKGKLKTYLMVALMAAIISVVSPFSIVIPISPVPITLATFAIYLTVYLIGCKYGTISTIIYVLLGFIGAPVFTGFTGGVAKVLGPTGGYIIGYIFLALIEGLIIGDRYESAFFSFLGMIAGTVVLYAFGTVWLAIAMHMTISEALFAAVLPFIPGDIVKMILAYVSGKKIKTLLIKAGII